MIEWFNAINDDNWKTKKGVECSEMFQLDPSEKLI